MYHDPHAFDAGRQGYRIVYRAGEPNHCPGCGRWVRDALPAGGMCRMCEAAQTWAPREADVAPRITISKTEIKLAERRARKEARTPARQFDQGGLERAAIRHELVDRRGSGRPELASSDDPLLLETGQAIGQHARAQAGQSAA